MTWEDRRLEYHREYYRKNRQKMLDQMREYREKNRDSILASSRAYYHANKASILSAKRLREFGVSQEQYDAMLQTQGGECAICRGEFAKGTYRLAVDHDHSTGAVRGLLCGNCNTALGKFRDSPGVLAAAIRYLRGHERI